VSVRLGLGALLVLGCHHSAGGPGPEPCTRIADPSGVPLPADSLAGEYRLQLTSDSGAATVAGILRLAAADPLLPARTGPFGIPDTTHRYPLVGTAVLDLAAVGAVAPGGTTSSDPAAPGVLVIERVNGRVPAERILLRLGAQANRADQTRFDGGYTVLRVGAIDRSGFRGEWESGAPLLQARGHLCASRANLP
jgi:hypothetical protein